MNVLCLLLALVLSSVSGGLDRFGRVRDLHWTLSDGETTVQRFGYGRNSAGELLHARVEQEGAVNTRSWLYGHDGLSRLRSAERGALAEGDDAIDRTTQGVPTPRRVSWGLDRLGNWTRGAGQTDGGGAFVYAGRRAEGVRRLTQGTRGRNANGRVV